MPRAQAAFQCSLCAKSYTTAYNLRMHVRTHTGERLRCERCPQKFIRENDLRVHTKEQHERDSRSSPLACPGCGKSFSRKTSVIRHAVKCRNELVLTPEEVIVVDTGTEPLSGHGQNEPSGCEVSSEHGDYFYSQQRTRTIQDRVGIGHWDTPIIVVKAVVVESLVAATDLFARNEYLEAIGVWRDIMQRTGLVGGWHPYKVAWKILLCAYLAKKSRQRGDSELSDALLDCVVEWSLAGNSGVTSLSISMRTPLLALLELEKCLESEDTERIRLDDWIRWISELRADGKVSQHEMIKKQLPPQKCVRHLDGNSEQHPVVLSNDGGVAPASSIRRLVSSIERKAESLKQMSDPSCVLLGSKIKAIIGESKVK